MGILKKIGAGIASVCAGIGGAIGGAIIGGIKNIFVGAYEGLALTLRAVGSVFELGQKIWGDPDARGPDITFSEACWDFIVGAAVGLPMLALSFTLAPVLGLLYGIGEGSYTGAKSAFKKVRNSLTNHAVGQDGEFQIAVMPSQNQARVAQAPIAFNQNNVLQAFVPQERKNDMDWQQPPEGLPLDFNSHHPESPLRFIKK